VVQKQEVATPDWGAKKRKGVSPVADPDLELRGAAAFLLALPAFLPPSILFFHPK